MKLPNETKPRKPKIKKKPISKPKKEKVLVVAQEFKFARLLSGNEKKTRDRVLKTLKKWLLNCFEKKYEFKEDDFIRVWKGLFYAVWMSDKPLVQEDLCDSIAAILDLFPADQVQHAILMTKAGLKVLATEWYGLDQHRIDKFLMLVRRYLRGSFRCLQRCEWSLKSCQMFANMLSTNDGILSLKTPQYARNSASLMLHIADCYLEELSKVSKGQIPDESVVKLLYPFCVQVCGGEGALAISSRRVLTALIRQSDLGLEYDNATNAWKRMGCPAGGPEALERISDDEADEDMPQSDEDMRQSDSNEQRVVDNGSEPLDPRAGRVDVTLEPLPVPAKLLADQLKQLMTHSSSKAYKRAKICMERFEELSRSRYPLRVPAADAQGLELPEPGAPRRSAARLRALEKQLVNESDELALRGLRRKHRKRLLARSRAGVNIVEELSSESTPAETTIGEWQVETTETAEKTDTGVSNKENHSKENKITKKKNRKRKLRDKSTVCDNKKSKLENKQSKVTETKVKEVKNINAVKEKPKDNKSDESKQNLKHGNEHRSKSDTKTSKKLLNSDKTNVNVTPILNNKDKKKVSDKLLNGKDEQTDATNKTLLRNKNNDKQNQTPSNKDKSSNPKVIFNKTKNYQKQVNGIAKKDMTPKKKMILETPKKVKFVLKNNQMQGPVDYYKSVRQSPNIPFDSSKKPNKTNLKPSTPSPINPFFKKKFKSKN